MFYIRKFSGIYAYIPYEITHSFNGLKSINVHSFCSLTDEIQRSVRFTETMMERIGLDAIAVDSFSMLVV